MKDNVKNYLIEHNEKNGHGTDLSDLMETLIDAPVVWEGEHDEHRWIIYFTRVGQVGDMFISYEYATCTGDNSLSDAGFEWDWDSVCECKPKEVKTIIYEPMK